MTTPTDSRPVRRTVDLFAGIGGFRYGLAAAMNDHCVFAAEWDRHARETYSRNHSIEPSAFAEDITEVLAHEVPDHEILTAGFPCQPFSLAGVSKRASLGYEHGFEHPTQGTLFFDVERIIAEKQPRVFILENVAHLIGHDRGNTWRVIKHVLSSSDRLGYHLAPDDYRIIDASAWVPQRRRRVFIVGFRDERDRDAFSWPTPPTTKRSLGQIMEKGPVDPKYTLSPKLWAYLREYAEKHRAQGNGFGFGLNGREDIARTLSARYYKDGAEILIRQPGSPRRLTPEECARLMGFPKRFKRHPSEVQAYRQLGNSVVVPVVRAVARQVERALVVNDLAERIGRPAAPRVLSVT